MGSSVLFYLCLVFILFTCTFVVLLSLLSPLSGLQSIKVAETCKQSDKMMAEYQEKLNSKISQKHEAYEENKQSQLLNMMKRLKDHVSCPARTQCMLSLFLFLALHAASV